MENVVDEMDNKFAKTENSIRKMNEKLDNFTEQMQNKENDEVEIIQLTKKLKEVKEDFAEVQNEAFALAKFQKEMASEFQQQILSTVQTLQALTDKQTASVNSTEATAHAINTLIGQSNVAEALTEKLKQSRE